ncbi:MAG: PAS domain-containing protein [Halomonas sp.]|uniref:PAS domain-containing protein n=1 Tax=Halomonas sp. TaxID=1486246 RepID=UPI0019F021A9|nr:PAS domain-containing protein [Halomonas sp.]MBE0489336.1 PAS domain-containing protein [Halomonas sp.]
MSIGPVELAHFWDLSPTGHAVVDEHGILLAANRTLANWMEEPPAALIGSPASELFTPTSRVLYLGLLAYRLAVGSRAEEIHLELAIPGGIPMPVLCSGRRIRYQGAHLVLLTLQEFSRKHAFEKEILEARQASEQHLKQREAR